MYCALHGNYLLSAASFPLTLLLPLPPASPGPSPNSSLLSNFLSAADALVVRGTGGGAGGGIVTGPTLCASPLDATFPPPAALADSSFFSSDPFDSSFLSSAPFAPSPLGAEIAISGAGGGGGREEPATRASLPPPPL